MGRQEFLTARLAYIDEMGRAGCDVHEVARNVQLTDLGQVSLLLATAREHPPTPTSDLGAVIRGEIWGLRDPGVYSASKLDAAVARILAHVAARAPVVGER